MDVATRVQIICISHNARLFKESHRDREAHRKDCDVVVVIY